MPNQTIIDLRHEIHQHPEVSNQEVNTSRRIAEFINSFHPDEVIPVASHGKAFIFDSHQPGPTVLFRSELDALPIQEDTDLEYRSQNQGVAHSCGHDGHMAVVAGLAQKISENRPQRGRVVFLYQPAEEVEQGARDVVEDPEFDKIKPDYVFALHNIPGEKKSKILLRKGTFAAASKGMTVTLSGKTAHAAEPENAITPSKAIARIINELDGLISNKSLFSDLTLLTIIHIRMGEVSFGTTPGFAEVMITLRAFENKDMELLTRKVESIIGTIAKDEKLAHTFSYSEVFPALESSPECVDIFEKAAKDNNLDYKYMDSPFRWSEDFSFFTEKYNGGYFGLGSGEDQPNLHNPDFNFPDEIIDTGINMFYSIYEQIISKL